MEKPITPKEALDQKVDNIPNAVTRAVNNLLKRKVSEHGNATLRISEVQEEILKEIKAEAEQYDSLASTPYWCKIGTSIPSAWYDFEPIFRKAGWTVTYDRPAYNESGETTWYFSS